uniref:Thioredoxin domain-containing protein n=1 Tax=Leptocylindrus danicus TaxID=163516 RepID=A0A7S2KB60_9STRA
MINRAPLQLLSLLLALAHTTNAMMDPLAEPEILTAENYVEKTAGKTIFVKFFSPKCEHCVTMAPIWEGLAKQYGKKRHGMIAAVDCSGEGRELCVKNKITNMPAVLWGDPDNLEPYTGGPEFEELYRFARRNLKPFCSANPDRQHLCTAEQNATIAEYEEMLHNGTLDREIMEKEDEIEAARDFFTVEATKLNDLANELHDRKTAVFDPEIMKIMKSVQGYHRYKTVFAKYGLDFETGRPLESDTVVRGEEVVSLDDDDAAPKKEDEEPSRGDEL